MNTAVKAAAADMIASYFPKGAVIPRPSFTPEWLRTRTLAAYAPYSHEWQQAQKQQEGYTQQPAIATLAMIQEVTPAEWAEIAKAIA